MMDLIGYLRRIMNVGAAETFDPATDSLEAITNLITTGAAGAPDGVYVDSANGVAGTAWPIGTPMMPVSNLTDALTILAARNLTHLYLVNPDDVFTAPAAMENYVISGAGQDRNAGYFDLNGQSFAGTVFHHVSLYGSVTTGGTPLVARDCLLDLNPVNGVGRFIRCSIFDFTLSNNSEAYFMQCYFPRDYFPILYFGDGADADLINCSGEVEIEHVIAGSIVNIHGNGLSIIINANCAAGIINLYGDIKVTDNHTAACVVNDYTNKPKAEVPVNITAIVASETNFLNLATAGFHYTIDDLVLKCADPGANTVNVKLYKLVNGVLTNTQTFAITNANFATYFDINTLFGLKSLAGDNIKITVQATAGGPYAVTGSYSYRSA